MFRYKRNHFIISNKKKVPFSIFAFENNKHGFEMLLNKLNFRDLSQEKIKEFESTSHYSLNAKLFLEKRSCTFMGFQPDLLSIQKISNT